MSDGFYMDDSYLNERAFASAMNQVEVKREKNTLILDKHVINSGFTKCNDSTTYIMEEEFPNYISYEKSIDDKYFITISKGLSNIDYENGWTVHVDNCDRCTIGSIDITTIYQYNTFMKALGIKDKLYYYN